MTLQGREPSGYVAWSKMPMAWLASVEVATVKELVICRAGGLYPAVRDWPQEPNALETRVIIHSRISGTSDLTEVWTQLGGGPIHLAQNGGSGTPPPTW